MAAGAGMGVDSGLPDFRGDAGFWKATAPHPEFSLLRHFGQRVPGGAFVYTSNIDGHFQKAGFDDERIVECHGSIDFNQCTRACGVGVFPAGPETLEIDETSMRAADPLPTCPNCGALARPNMVMIGG